MESEIDRLTAALADRYRLERELGRGAMAAVYLAEDLRHHRQVAIKVLHPELAATLGAERFVREIEIAAKLTHPHILPLYDSGEANGFLYYVMPYVEGESLRDRLTRERQFPVDDAIEITLEVADALSYAHSHGVIHRDIKPENILIESGHAVVADFGIARAISAAGGETLTATGLAIGTPVYMSPEQAAGVKELDGRSDLYGLGCVLYEMLAGQPPFTGPTVENIVHQHLTVEPRNITSVRPAVPAAVAAALQRSLAKTPADRFNPVALFGEALRGTPTAAHPAQDVVPLPATPPIEHAARLRTSSHLRAAAGVLGLLVLAVASWWIMTQRGSARVVSAAPSIAVLPFADMSPGGQNEYFADGMAEEVLNALARVPGLKVAARTSAFAFKGKNEDIRTIGEKLGVATVLEGSVRREGITVRITAQLINVADGFHLWSDTYEREQTSIFAMQDEIARAVVQALRLRLGGDHTVPLAPVPTTNLEAHDEYLRGRFHWAKRTPEGLRMAIQHFERAIALDSAYVLAYAGLADAYVVLPFWDVRAVPAEGFASSWMAAEKAVALDPNNAVARASRGYAWLMNRWDLNEAERELRRAIQLDPAYATAHHWLADVLSFRGKFPEAIAAERRALEIDPLSLVSTQNLAWILRFDRQYLQAILQYEKALDLDPARAATWLDLAVALLPTERADYAARALTRWAELVGANRDMFGRVPELVSRHRMTGDPAQLPPEVEATPALHPIYRARLYALAGDRKRALDWIERVFQDRWPQALEVRVDPAFATLRNDPRFAALVRTIKY